MWEVIKTNKRIMKKKIRQRCNCYTTKKQRSANKALCDRYPFLIPRHVWTDKVFWLHKPYDYTLAEDFPKGWWKAFGIQLCEELREECIKHDYLHQLRLTQIKEKYAELRIYFGLIPVGCRVHDIVDDYSALSGNICEYCGRPDTAMIMWGGWYTTICEDCYNKIQRRNQQRFGHKPIAYSTWEASDPLMANERRYTRYIPGKEKEEHVVDLTDKAEKIRARWRASHADVSNV